MPFPNEHIYFTVHWLTYGTGETGQFGLRFDNTAPLTQAMVNACATPVQTMWSSAGAGIEDGYRLTFLRAAKIGTDGKYLPGSVSLDYTYSNPPVGGGGITIARYPLQTALATTLTTAIPRGQASKGRIYLPWINQALGSDYLFPLTQANSRSAAVATMLTALNVQLGPLCVFSKGTKTSTAGAKHVVTGVKTGRRPDVQRRRAKQQVESYGALSTVS